MQSMFLGLGDISYRCVSVGFHPGARKADEAKWVRVGELEELH